VSNLVRVIVSHKMLFSSSIKKVNADVVILLEVPKSATFFSAVEDVIHPLSRAPAAYHAHDPETKQASAQQTMQPVCKRKFNHSVVHHCGQKVHSNHNASHVAWQPTLLAPPPRTDPLHFLKSPQLRFNNRKS
jgi:hypothetical protein